MFDSSPANPSRREVLKATAAGAVLVAAPRVHAAGDDIGAGIKIGVIGCGGRGGGATLDALGAAKESIYPELGYHTENVVKGAKASRAGVEVVALADLFEDRLLSLQTNLEEIGHGVPEERRFVGFDACEKLLAIPEINYVILATPPHFRPDHVMAAVEAGKNCFMEKPAAVDAPGVRKVIEAGRIATAKGLSIAAGTQRRHQADYREAIGRLHDGAVGQITHAKCYWNGGEIWVVPRKPEWSDVEWQIRNWNYFTWSGGDHIVEQHVHNLDVINWALQSHPIRAVSGIGGRQVRTKSVHGNIYDHFAVEYEYPGGVSVFSQCRQINGCKSTVGEEVFGTGGWSNCRNTIIPKSGERWRMRRRGPQGYEAEHAHLIAAIREGKPINEAQAIAESTLTAILGREAAYSGQEIAWDDAIASDTRLGPERYEFGDLPIAKVPMPGKYNFT